MARAARKTEAPPQDQVRNLLAGLKSGELPPAVVLKGDERYFLDQATSGLIQAGETRGLEICRFDGSDPEFQVGALIGDLLGGALFASARLFVLRSLETMLKSGGRGDALGEAILARLGANDGTCIVLLAGGLRANTKLMKGLTDAGAMTVTCRKLWDSPPPWDPDPRKAELVQWLVGRARERKLSLPPEQAAYVVAATGNDLFALDSQLDRLAATGGNVGAGIVWQGSTSPFQLAEPLLAGDAPRAVAGIENLFQGGFQGRDGSRTVDPGALVALLFSATLSKLRETAAAAEVQARGGAPDEVLEAGGGKGAPSTQQAFLQRLSLRSAADWARMYVDLAELERRSRTGADVDAADFVAFALRWRQKGPQGPAARPRGGSARR